VGPAGRVPGAGHGRWQHTRVPGHHVGAPSAERHQLLSHVAGRHRSHGRRARHARRHTHFSQRYVLEIFYVVLSRFNEQHYFEQKLYLYLYFSS